MPCPGIKKDERAGVFSILRFVLSDKYEAVNTVFKVIGRWTRKLDLGLPTVERAVKPLNRLAGYASLSEPFFETRRKIQNALLTHFCWSLIEDVFLMSKT